MKSTRTFTTSEIENAKKYKYNGTDDSICAKLFLRRFWDWLIKFFSLSIAANTITFIGFLFEFVSFIVSFSLSDCLESRIPVWSQILNGISLFIYQTLDNLDGRQARRTGTSSPLGQFFDHGCDAITGVFIMIQVITTLNLGNTLESFIFIYLMGIGFALTSYEEYVTHSFYLGYLNAPDEGLLLLSILHIAVAIVPQIAEWLKDPIVYFLYLLGAGACILPIIYNVIKKSICNLEVRQRAIIGAIPLLLSIGLTALMITINPAAVHNTFIIIFSSLLLQYQAQLTIVAYLVKREPKRLFDSSLYIFWSFIIAACLFSNFLVYSQLFWILSTYTLIIFIVIFDIGVVLSLSEGLKIPVFTVIPKDNLDMVEPENQNEIKLDIEEEDEKENTGLFEQEIIDKNQQ
ncbi:hypothetical protein M9Y10_000123 [Tritrichomonas musculus]|uniref:CDP-alcohol phosphatidyltransferase family protein n=1 Tax=Tritrichomonas musculus TaxID=1915356 RepID=A0ABR2L3G7_9EUKA